MEKERWEISYICPFLLPGYGSDVRSFQLSLSWLHLYEGLYLEQWILKNPFFPYVALVGVFPHSSRTETKTHISVHVSLRPTSGNVMYGNKLPLLWKVKTRFAFQNFFPTIIWTQVYGIRKPLHTFTFFRKFDIFQLSIIGTVQSYPLPQRKH